MNKWLLSVLVGCSFCGKEMHANVMWPPKKSGSYGLNRLTPFERMITHDISSRTANKIKRLLRDGALLGTYFAGLFENVSKEASTTHPSDLMDCFDGEAFDSNELSMELRKIEKYLLHPYLRYYLTSFVLPGARKVCQSFPHLLEYHKGNAELAWKDFAVVFEQHAIIEPFSEKASIFIVKDNEQRARWVAKV